MTVAKRKLIVSKLQVSNVKAKHSISYVINARIELIFEQNREAVENIGFAPLVVDLVFQ